MSLTLTLVRHGESTDNLKALWAGHRDAPLTVHGMNQARRLGKSFENVAITKIYASDLKRAHWTSLQIATQNKGLQAQFASYVSSCSHDAQTSSTSTSLSSPLAGLGRRNGTDESTPLSTPVKQTASRSSSMRNNGDDAPNPAEVADTTAGPRSIVSTDRVPEDASESASHSPIVSPPLHSHNDENEMYDDDFTLSSSSAASSSAIQSFSPSTSTSLTEIVTTTPLLREQFFGLAEGQSWKTGYATSANAHHNRSYKFEGGESLQDVHSRADEVVKRCVVPWLVRAVRRSVRGRADDSRRRGESTSTSGEDDADAPLHVVLVAHGIMISELLYAISKLQDPRASYMRQSGHTNTGWTRFSLRLDSSVDISTLSDPTLPPLISQELPAAYTPSLSSGKNNSIVGHVIVSKTHGNMTTHLNGLKRTKGGVGSSGFDSKQRGLSDFFAGGGSCAPADDGAATQTHGGKKESNGAATETHGGKKESNETTWKVNAKTTHTPVIDLTSADDAESEGKHSKREHTARQRFVSPPSPSPKKGRLS